MRVLLVGTGRFSEAYGGGQVYVRNLASGLSANGHEVSYLSLSFNEIIRASHAAGLASLPKASAEVFRTLIFFLRIQKKVSLNVCFPRHL